MNEYINMKKFTPWFVVNEEKGQFLVVDWGVCDTIDGVEWTMDRLYATEFTDEEKEMLDNRWKDKNMTFAQHEGGEWIKYEKFVETKYIKYVENSNPTNTMDEQ